MPVRPFEPDVTERPRDSGQEPRRDAAGKPEMRAAPRDDEQPHRAEESIDEPGYGHGV